MPSRLRKFRQRFGIAAPRIAVRTQFAWYWRWLGILVLLATAFALALWMYDTGRRFAGFDRDEIEQRISGLQSELRVIRAERGALRSELDNLRAANNSAESRLSIERAAQVKLGEQIRVLERDNARLREELATFEAMLSSEARSAQPLSVYRFKVTPDVLPGEYRYRLLLLTAGTRREREFQGRLELIVTLNESGKSAMMVFPEPKDAAAASFRLAFKYFHRVEGTFRVNPKARIEGVQVRIYETGSSAAKVTRNATLG